MSTQQLLKHWPTVTIGPSGENLSALTFEDLMGESPRVSLTEPQVSLSIPRVSLRSLSDSELSHCKMLREQGCNMLNLIPKPSKCSDEQLALALGYLFSLTDEELSERHRYVTRMQQYLRDPKNVKPHKSLRLRNLAIYADLLEQAIAARLQGTLRKTNASTV